MCGITGIFDTNGNRAINESLLHTMNESQFHRGPDEGGIHIEPGLGLGHRRLSIIDISTGQQPMFNHDGSVCIVFNGEIYNFREIRTELEQLGYQFATNSDTETIVHAWEAWGEKCVSKLRGMFAFAIWDRKLDTLFLARDRVGIKPLFYALLPDGHFIFGSELKALTSHTGLERQLEPEAIEEYFSFGYVPEPRTIYKNVYKLSPGHSLCITRGRGVDEPKCYWDLTFETSTEIDLAGVTGELIERFKEAVNIRLVSEVPLGAFLSGGVDSGGVVSMMAQLQSDPVNTCAIGFNEKKFNETEFAQMVAERYQTNHFTETVDPNDFDLLDHLASLYDEPYADSSAIPTYRVCELAKQRVTVALSGDGGDETFAGYRRYKWHMNEEKLRGLLPLNVRKPIFGALGKVYPKADWAPRVLRAKSTFQSLALDSVQGYFHTVSHTRDQERSLLFSDQFKRELQGYTALEVFRGHAKRFRGEDILSLIQYLDFKTYLVGDILTKVDRASMAHALEVRVPILDHQFLEWCAQLPSSIKLKGQSTKDIFKKALEPHLPDDVLYRPKMGFGVPLAEWFRGPLKERVRYTLLGESLADSGFFNMDHVRSIVNQHQNGTRDFSTAIWSLFMFESFLRECFQDRSKSVAA